MVRPHSSGLIQVAVVSAPVLDDAAVEHIALCETARECRPHTQDATVTAS